MSVFVLECSDFWGSKIQVDVIKGGEGGVGSDLNDQLTLSEGKVNLSTAPNLPANNLATKNFVVMAI